MPGTFWTGWQLWEKMCFILGSAIMLVILAGLMKLVYNHYRLRKYSQLAASQAALRQTLGRSATGKRGRADVPFGIRAIESGVEVDGVWISGSNTPATSTPGSPTLSASTETPRPHVRGASPIEQQTNHTDPPRIEIGQPSFRSQSTGPHVTRPSYQPRRSSGLRFSDSHELTDQDIMLSELEAPSPISGPHPHREVESAEEHNFTSSRRSTSWSTTSFGQTMDGNLQSSTGAGGPGSGFLHPRYAHVNKNEMAESLQEGEHSTDTQENKGESPPSECSDPFVTPTQSTQDSKTSSPGSDCTVKDDSGRGQPQTTNSSTFTTVIGGQTDEQSDQSRGQSTTYESQIRVRDTHVLRKINSGFEILRPGTLDQPRPSPSKHTDVDNGNGNGKGDGNANSTFVNIKLAPPAEGIDGVPTKEEKRSSKKLQKKKVRESR